MPGSVPLESVRPTADALSVFGCMLAPEVRRAARLFLARRHGCVSYRGSLAGIEHEVTHALCGVMAPLAQDVIALARRYNAITGREILRVRLERVVSDMCCRFHVDCLDLRLLRTYVGPGVQWSDDDGATVRQTPREAVILLKGTHDPQWAATGRILHRSPPLSSSKGAVQGRVLLTIDGTDPCPDGVSRGTIAEG